MDIQGVTDVDIILCAGTEAFAALRALVCVRGGGTAAAVRVGQKQLSQTRIWFLTLRTSDRNNHAKEFTEALTLGFMRGP